jgi:peroxiredoxin
VGVSADHAATLDAFVKQNTIKHLLLSDFRRQMLPGWGALETNEQSPIYRYAKRAYFVIDREGVVRYQKIQPNALDLL